MSFFDFTSKRKTTLLLVSILFYIFISFGYFIYLLDQKNEEAFKQKGELLAIQYYNQVEPVLVNFFDSEVYNEHYSEYTTNRNFIWAQGAIFIILFLLAFWFVQRTLFKDLELNERQRNFLLSITHELKSPLASIRLSLQTLIMRKLDHIKTAKLSNNAMKDVDRLNMLVENILLAARMESDGQLLKVDFDLSSLLKNIVNHQIQQSPNHNISTEIEENIELFGDRNAISSVLMNLVENAVKYSDKETHIFVQLTQKDNSILFEVKDEGWGIPDDEKHKIFDKFYRIGDENKRRTKGTGLGLYLVKEIVLAHNGKIAIENNQPKGSIFIVEF